MSNEIKNKERKVFWEVLPKYESGAHKGDIFWKGCIGLAVKFIYDDMRGEFEIVGYELKRNYHLTLKYNGDILNTDISTNNFKNCKIGNLIGKVTGEYKANIGDIFKHDNRDILVTNRKRGINKSGIENKYYQYKCNKCGFDCGEHYRNGEFRKEHWLIESGLLNGKGCSCCNSYLVSTNINSIWVTDRWMCDLGVSEEDAKIYTSQSGNKITVKCPDCGKLKKITISQIYSQRSISCICNDGKSYPEKFMLFVLDILGVDYIVEYSPKYLIINGGQKRSDFYLPKYNLIVEMDGRMGHEGGIVHNSEYKTIEDCVELDKWKDDQHLLHGVRTIRINCFESNMEYIKNSILNSELVNYFDFNKVDWLECDKFAVKNRVKEVCDYWNQKEEWETVLDLAKKLKISRDTITRYLKRGTKFNWCYYNGKDEIRKSSTQNGVKTGKPVEIFKDGISLGLFGSATCLSKLSNSIFGINFISGNITSVCRGESPHHKGYTFRYITKEEYEQRKSQSA